MFKGRDVQLVCGACEAVFADAHLGPLATSMNVTSIVSGAEQMPRNGYRVNAETRTRLDRAEAEAEAGDGTPTPELIEARAVHAYLKLQAGEIIYDVSCRCGRRYLRSSPHLRTEIRRTQGRWVRLSPGMASWSPPSETPSSH